MDELYRAYLNFVRAMSRGLESLTVLNEKKLAAAQSDDLMTLNELLNQEQAQSLNFRGLELTRDKLLPQLGLVNVPLSEVPDHFPRPAAGGPPGRGRAAEPVSGLSENRREDPEPSGADPPGGRGHHCAAGRSPAGSESGPGYHKESESAPPPSMKTDFRA